MERGVVSHGEGNWLKGIAVKHLLNHAIAHVYAHLDGDGGEDHLGHAVANLCMACHSDENWGHLNGGET